MKLVLENIGKDTLDIVKVRFEISYSTTRPGYASNRSDASVEGEGKTDDYSFRVNGDQPPLEYLEIFPTTDEVQLHGGAYSGKMEPNSTWVNFYCKDYGGTAFVYAHIYVKDGMGGSKRQATVPVTIPKDVDSDGLADKWELEMGARWRAQYAIPAGTAAWDTEAKVLALFHPDMDDERADPDEFDITPAGPLVAQAEAGDAHTIRKEYRGYILDGGGLNGFGGGGHPGGHIRLDPARKEILVEVDRAAVINNLPGAGNDTTAKLKTILNGASGLFSNNTRGAGIYMYWMMDEDALNLPLAELNTEDKIKAAFSASRDTVAQRAATTLQSLTTDFIHLFVVDENGIGAVTSAYDVLSKRGSMLAVTDMINTQTAPLILAKFDERLMTATAHEITHLLVEKKTGAFDALEHTSDANGVGGADDTQDQTDIMYYGKVRGRMEIDTVKFFPVVQVEIKVKSNQALV